MATTGLQMVPHHSKWIMTLYSDSSSIDRLKTPISCNFHFHAKFSRLSASDAKFTMIWYNGCKKQDMQKDNW